MPSIALVNWRTTRTPNLLLIDAQCVACVAAVPPNPALIDENLRAYVLLLSAHFQGFCRDLHTECALILATRIRSSLRMLFQSQFVSQRELDRSNANFGTIVADFNRFGFALKPILDGLPGSAALKRSLHDLNEWRNAAAHQNTVLPAGGPLTAPMVQGWRDLCDTLATALDGILYNQLRRRLRRAPWVP